MKRVLVTGVAGFIGSHMAEGLLKIGYQVVGIDNLSTGDMANLPPGVRFLRGDVRRDRDLARAFRQPLDGVFHIAGCASTIRSFDDPLQDLRTNTLGTVQVVLRCLRHRVPRLLYASSMTVYGEPRHLPVDVEGETARPISYYGISKYAAERYVMATGARSDIGFRFGTTAFRMFNVYGRRQSLDNPYQGVASIFIGKILRREPIYVFGDGKQSRDFVHISDVVDAWLRAFRTPRAIGQVFNLGSGKRLSIQQLLRIDIRAFGLNPRSYPIRYFPARPGDQRHMQADIRKTKRLLGWRPRMPLAEGMRNVVAWARGS